MKRVVACSLWLWSLGAACFAGSVEFTSGNANVSFSLVSSNVLQVTLTNNSLMTATSPNDVLTGVHFSTQQNLSPVMAYVNGVQNLLNCPSCSNASMNIGSEWAYQNAVSGLAPTAVNLLGAADFGTFSLSNRFDTGNIAGTTGVGGIDFGIVGPGGVNAALSGSPLVSRQAVFVFTTGRGFDTNSIGSVGFVYGSGNYVTAYNNLLYGATLSSFASAPEPQSWALIGLGVAALGWMRRKRAA
ncbi:MAG: PEP-CTERM sorting domain-containing protein [Bryobacterales bacterium]|nr:PEP-CTERM sorting domain-containing protein [Bryobacterales bacterium]